MLSWLGISFGLLAVIVSVCIRYAGILVTSVLSVLLKTPISYGHAARKRIHLQEVDVAVSPLQWLSSLGSKSLLTITLAGLEVSGGGQSPASKLSVRDENATMKRTIGHALRLASFFARGVAINLRGIEVQVQGRTMSFTAATVVFSRPLPMECAKLPDVPLPKGCSVERGQASRAAPMCSVMASVTQFTASDPVHGRLGMASATLQVLVDAALRPTSIKTTVEELNVEALVSVINLPVKSASSSSPQLWPSVLQKFDGIRVDAVLARPRAHVRLAASGVAACSAHSEATEARVRCEVSLSALHGVPGADVAIAFAASQTEASIWDTNDCELLALKLEKQQTNARVVCGRESLGAVGLAFSLLRPTARVDVMKAAALQRRPCWRTSAAAHDARTPPVPVVVTVESVGVVLLAHAPRSSASALFDLELFFLQPPGGETVRVEAAAHAVALAMGSSRRECEWEEEARVFRNTVGNSDRRALDVERVVLSVVSGGAASAGSAGTSSPGSPGSARPSGITVAVEVSIEGAKAHVAPATIDAVAFALNDWSVRSPFPGNVKPSVTIPSPGRRVWTAVVSATESAMTLARDGGDGVVQIGVESCRFRVESSGAFSAEACGMTLREAGREAVVISADSLTLTRHIGVSHVIPVRHSAFVSNLSVVISPKTPQLCAGLFVLLWARVDACLRQLGAITALPRASSTPSPSSMRSPAARVWVVEDSPRDTHTSSDESGNERHHALNHSGGLLNTSLNASFHDPLPLRTPARWMVEVEGVEVQISGDGDVVPPATFIASHVLAAPSSELPSQRPEVVCTAAAVAAGDVQLCSCASLAVARVSCVEDLAPAIASFAEGRSMHALLEGSARVDGWEVRADSALVTLPHAAPLEHLTEQMASTMDDLLSAISLCHGAPPSSDSDNDDEGHAERDALAVRLVLTAATVEVYGDGFEDRLGRIFELGMDEQALRLDRHRLLQKHLRKQRNSEGADASKIAALRTAIIALSTRKNSEVWIRRSRAVMAPAQTPVVTLATEVLDTTVLLDEGLREGAEAMAKSILGSDVAINDNYKNAVGGEVYCEVGKLQVNLSDFPASLLEVYDAHIHGPFLHLPGSGSTLIRPLVKSRGGIACAVGPCYLPPLALAQDSVMELLEQLYPTTVKDSTAGAATGSERHVRGLVSFDTGFSLHLRASSDPHGEVDEIVVEIERIVGSLSPSKISFLASSARVVQSLSKNEPWELLSLPAMDVVVLLDEVMEGDHIGVHLKCSANEHDTVVIGVAAAKLRRLLQCLGCLPSAVAVPVRRGTLWTRRREKSSSIIDQVRDLRVRITCPLEVQFWEDLSRAQGAMLNCALDVDVVFVKENAWRCAESKSAGRDLAVRVYSPQGLVQFMSAANSESLNTSSAGYRGTLLVESPEVLHWHGLRPSPAVEPASDANEVERVVAHHQVVVKDARGVWSAHLRDFLYLWVARFGAFQVRQPDWRIISSMGQQVQDEPSTSTTPRRSRSQSSSPPRHSCSRSRSVSQTTSGSVSGSGVEGDNDEFEDDEVDDAQTLLEFLEKSGGTTVVASGDMKRQSSSHIPAERVRVRLDASNEAEVLEEAIAPPPVKECISVELHHLQISCLSDNGEDDDLGCMLIIAEKAVASLATVAAPPSDEHNEEQRLIVSLESIRLFAAVLSKDRTSASWDPSTAFQPDVYAEHPLSPVTPPMFAVATYRYYSGCNPQHPDEVNTLDVKLPEVQVRARPCEFHVLTDVFGNLLFGQPASLSEEKSMIVRVLFQSHLGPVAMRDLSSMQASILELRADVEHITGVISRYTTDARYQHAKYQKRLGDLERTLAKKEDALGALKQSATIISARAKETACYCSLQGQYAIDRASVILCDDDQTPFAELSWEHLEGSLRTNSDRSGTHSVQVQSLELNDVVQGSYFPKVLAPLQQTDGPTLRLYLKMGSPVAGVAVFEHIELNVAPFAVCLSKDVYESLKTYFFPDGEDHGKDVKETKDTKKRWQWRKQQPARLDVELMEDRASRYVTFQYVKISTTSADVSYKEVSTKKSIWDIENKRIMFKEVVLQGKTCSWLQLVDLVEDAYKSTFWTQLPALLVGSDGTQAADGDRALLAELEREERTGKGKRLLRKFFGRGRSASQGSQDLEGELPLEEEDIEEAKARGLLGGRPPARSRERTKSESYKM